MDKNKTRFGALDGWRGVAALGVVAFHFGVNNHFYAFPPFRVAEPYVDFFFVLSGFVVTHAYAGRVDGWHDIGTFMIRRFGRLWPLHVFTLSCLIGLEFAKLIVMWLTGLTAGSGAFAGESAAAAIPAHLLMLQAFGLFDSFTWNIPSWSIGAEFWTYLVFALVCVAGSSRRHSITAMLLLSTFLALLVFDDLNDTYQLGFVRCVFFFFVGKLTYELKGRFDNRYGKLTSATAVECLLVAIACASIIAMPMIEIHGRALRFLLLLVVLPAMLLVFSREEGKISRFLLTRPMQALGEWSYSMYMIHFVLITLMNAVLRVLDRILDAQLEQVDVAAGHGPSFFLPFGVGDLLFVAYLGAVIALASQTFRFVEDPCRIYFNRLARAREQSQSYRVVPSVSGE